MFLVFMSPFCIRECGGHHFDLRKNENNVLSVTVGFRIFRDDDSWTEQHRAISTVFSDFQPLSELSEMISHWLITSHKPSRWQFKGFSLSDLSEPGFF